MNKQKYIPLIISFLFIVGLLGCTPDEELLTGDITGGITATNENGYKVSPGGISVTLENDSLSFQEVTDSNGWYTFRNIPMGNYDVTIGKEGYVNSKRHFLIQHIGGFSPTYESFSIQEVPKYKLLIDSIAVEKGISHDDLDVFGIFLNRSGEPRLGYPIRIYAHTSPDVSPSNYTEVYTNYIMNREITGENFQFRFEVSHFYEPGDTIYFCIYPTASVSDWYIMREDTLGPPSEIFAWVAE